MITESFKDTNSEKVRLRNARGSNLAWNIAGLIIFSLFNWIGIPVTLTGLSKYVSFVLLRYQSAINIHILRSLINPVGVRLEFGE